MDMHFNQKRVTIGGGVLLLVILLLWFFFFRSTPQAPAPTNNGFVATPDQTTPVSVTPAGTQSTNTSAQNSKLRIFKIADGPVAGAVFIQTHTPTTTLARYAMADNGHVLDLAIDVPGAVAQPASGTTIPGIVGVVWEERGAAAILQYLDGNILKTLYMNFPLAATSTATSTRSGALILFLPDNSISLVSSPDGKSLAYLLRTSAGVDGYIAASDGGGAKKLFSLQVSQVTLAWPSQNTLLAVTKPATGVPGMAFSINAKTGVAIPLVYAPGLSAIATRDFSRVVYQTTPPETTDRSTYSHNVVTGINAPLSFDPFPERCVWSAVATTTMYCAEPLAYLPQNYLDLWHQGTIGGGDSVVGFNVATGASLVITTPGGVDGGVASDIAQMAVSLDNHYLLFVTRGDHSLWVVRLMQ